MYVRRSYFASVIRVSHLALSRAVFSVWRIHIERTRPDRAPPAQHPPVGLRFFPEPGRLSPGRLLKGLFFVQREGKKHLCLCEGCLGECMLSFDQDVQVFKCFSRLTWFDIPKKSLQKPRARTANSMNRPCEHGGINTNMEKTYGNKDISINEPQNEQEEGRNS